MPIKDIEYDVEYIGVDTIKHCMLDYVTFKYHMNQAIDKCVQLYLEDCDFVGACA